MRVLPAGGKNEEIVLPASAVLDPPAVWVVDRTTNTVSIRPVTLKGAAGDFSIVSSGLSNGDEVVIKGIHSLEEGQAVGPRVSE